MGKEIVGGRNEAKFFIKFVLIGCSESLSDVFGKPIKDLTDIEILGYITARKYHIGELKREQSKEQETEFEKEEGNIKLSNKFTLENLLKYNNIEKG